jgi:3-hydroxyacyl-[acyl-carrier-protein] dehydratase
VAARDFIVDPATLDPLQVIANIDEIRQCNPQRFEMEMLTAVVYLDPVNVVALGYRDVTHHEFWVRGHMPGRPLMPGVIMCETAAQLCGFMAKRFGLLGEGIIAFGGLEGVRFRGPVVPGDRLFMACRKQKLRPDRMIQCDFQGIVGSEIVCEGQLIGVVLRADQIPTQR